MNNDDLMPEGQRLAPQGRASTRRLPRLMTAASLVVFLAAGCGFADDLTSSSSSGETKSTDTRAPEMIAGIQSSDDPWAAYVVPPAGSQASEGADEGETVVPGNPPVDVSKPGADQGTPSAPAATAPPVQSPPAASPSGAINSVDTIISDMTDYNDIALKGVDLKYGFATGPGFVVMGNDPRGTNTPAWYQNSYPKWVNGTYWNLLLPWFVEFEGEGNAASNTRIQMRKLKIFVKSRATGAWTKINPTENVGGVLCPPKSNYFHCSGSATISNDASGIASFLPLAGQNLHGWWGGRVGINGPDVAAVMVTLQARLVMNNPGGVDDRGRARYLIHVGADYYPTNGSAETVLPGVGVSRAKLVTPEWRSFTMTTFSDAGKQEPGGGITRAQLRADPPPLD